jgi:trk system potassium uptake protein TrkA
MKIIICGAGHIGASLVHYLSSEYPMVVIDTDSAVLDQMASRYDVQILCGSASDPMVLDRANLTDDTQKIHPI